MCELRYLNAFNNYLEKKPLKYILKISFVKISNFFRQNFKSKKTVKIQT